MNQENSFADSNHLQNAISHIDNTRVLVASFLKDKKSDAVALLNLNGVKINNFAPLSQVTTAFLTAIKDSDSFRKQVSQSLTNYIQSPTGTKSFNGIGFQNSNFNGVGFSNGNGAGYYNLFDAEEAAATTTGATPTTKPASSGGSFWDGLGKIFTPDVIKNGINTGLGALGTSIQSNANNTSQQNAIELERIRLAQIQAAGAAGVGAGAKPGLSTGWKVAIGIGAGAIFIFCIVMAVKVYKKK